MRLLLAIVFTLFLGPAARAEYRVYLLQIQNQAGQKRTVETTLDNLQYPTYYPLAAGETLIYLDSWMCYGRTSDFKPYCANPRSKPKPAPTK